MQHFYFLAFLLDLCLEDADLFLVDDYAFFQGVYLLVQS